MKKRIAVIVFMSLGILCAGGCGRKQEILWESESQACTTETNTENPNLSGETACEIFTEPETESALYIDISGAVKNPGVYQLANGARLYEAIACAGGLLPDADTALINQARCLSDQEKIHIYTIQEREMSAICENVNDMDTLCEADVRETISDGKVNINTADEMQLMTLPGIGASRAQDIIAFRMQSGPFSSIEDIMQVNGIKEAIFQKLKDNISVG